MKLLYLFKNKKENKDQTFYVAKFETYHQEKELNLLEIH